MQAKLSRLQLSKDDATFCAVGTKMPIGAAVWKYIDVHNIGALLNRDVCLDRLFAKFRGFDLPFSEVNEALTEPIL